MKQAWGQEEYVSSSYKRNSFFMDFIKDSILFTLAGATKTVSSPAMVPNKPSFFKISNCLATKGADPGDV
jgi:hypothetical protein